MRCETFEYRLQAFLDGELAVEDRRAVEAHVEGCPRCRQLVRLMELGPAALAHATPDLTGDVLKRTSGPACARAEELVGDHVDGTLDGLDDELLRMHLEGCEGCAALAKALRRLGEDLPAMALMTPDAAFVRDVLKATLPPRPGLAERFRDAWTRRWPALAARPRLAWEVGYVGAMALWLGFGIFGAPMQAGNPVPSTETSVALVRSVKAGVSELGQRAWAAAEVVRREKLSEIEVGVAERYVETELTLEDMRRHGSEMTDAALRGELDESSRAFMELQRDTHSLLGRLVSPEPTE